MASRKCIYDADFHDGAVQTMTETGKPIPGMVEDLGIHPGTLHSWVSRAGATGRRRRTGHRGATYGLRLGVGQVLVVVQGQQPHPGVEITGEVHGEHPAAVHIPGGRGQVVQSVAIGAGPVLDAGVRAVQHIQKRPASAEQDRPPHPRSRYGVSQRKPYPSDLYRRPMGLNRADVDDLQKGPARPQAHRVAGQGRPPDVSSPSSTTTCPHWSA